MPKRSANGALPPAIDGALRLTVLTTVLVGGISWIHALTKDRIAEQQRKIELQNLAAVLPSDFYDNDPLSDTIAVTDAASLGTAQPHQVYRARLAGRPSALVLQATAPDGYNGDIKLLIGLAVDGTVLGVRVISHRETPGLGDKIERRVSDWVDGFRDRNANESQARWRVKKDGGEFDQFTGATITPRAVVKAVRRAVDYATHNRDHLYSAQPPQY